MRRISVELMEFNGSWIASMRLTLFFFSFFLFFFVFFNSFFFFLNKVPAFYRILLTGTPLQNNLRELWALFHYLMPDVFPAVTAETFEEGFDAQRDVVNMNRMEGARKLLSLFMLRRTKAQISVNLPSKTEVGVVCGLSEAQQNLYKTLLTGVGDINGDNISEGDYRKLLNLLLQLRKVRKRWKTKLNLDSLLLHQLPRLLEGIRF